MFIKYGYNVLFHMCIYALNLTYLMKLKKIWNA